MKQGFDVQKGDVIAVWFSCGAASATALKKVVLRYGHMCEVRAMNNPVIEEHPDNIRFKNDVEKWTKIKIEDVRNSKYPNASAVEVWDKRKYMSGVAGAPCTGELKKFARQEWEKNNHHDWIVLGFTSDEAHRYWNFYTGERSNILPILLEQQITKDKCYEYIKKAGIELPEIYSIGSDFGTGFPNANCIGCVKSASPTYWNHVRQTFPDVFEKRASQSREIGCKLVRYKGERIYLDELPNDARGQSMKTMKIDCGSFCTEKEF